MLKKKLEINQEAWKLFPVPHNWRWHTNTGTSNSSRISIDHIKNDFHSPNTTLQHATFPFRRYFLENPLYNCRHGTHCACVSHKTSLLPYSHNFHIVMTVVFEFSFLFDVNIRVRSKILGKTLLELTKIIIYRFCFLIYRFTFSMVKKSWIFPKFLLVLNAIVIQSKAINQFSYQGRQHKKSSIFDYNHQRRTKSIKLIDSEALKLCHRTKWWARQWYAKIRWSILSNFHRQTSSTMSVISIFWATRIIRQLCCCWAGLVVKTDISWNIQRFMRIVGKWRMLYLLRMGP